MTGAVLSHHASRRADGLATSAALEQNTPASLGKACELSPARNPDAAMLRTPVIPAQAGIQRGSATGFPRCAGEMSEGQRGHTPSIKRASLSFRAQRGISLPFLRQQKGDAASEARRRGFYTPQPSRSNNTPHLLPRIRYPRDILVNLLQPQVVFAVQAICPFHV